MILITVFFFHILVLLILFNKTFSHFLIIYFFFFLKKLEVELNSINVFRIYFSNQYNTSSRVYVQVSTIKNKNMILLHLLLQYTRNSCYFLIVAFFYYEVFFIQITLQCYLVYNKYKCGMMCIICSCHITLISNTYIINCKHKNIVKNIYSICEYNRFEKLVGVTVFIQSIIM